MVEITHPFHPLRGQSFRALKTRRVSGKVTLILRSSSGGTFCVPRAWTDRATAPRYVSPEPGGLILDFGQLMALADLLTALEKSQQGRLRK